MSQAEQPAYFMVQINAKNFGELLQRYGQYAIPMLSTFGGEMIAGSPNPTLLEGEWDGNWAAVLRFPSMEAARAWYDSPEYRPLRQLRIDELTEPGGRVMLVGAFDPSGQGG
jgi:uncharacterized protein (DUF1330 family)